MTKNDILARLRSGVSVDEIAGEMAQALNDAQADYIQEQNERIKADERHQAQVTAAKHIIDALNDYLTVSGFGDEVVSYDELELEQLTDNLEDGIRALIELRKALSEVSTKQDVFSSFSDLLLS